MQINVVSLYYYLDKNSKVLLDTQNDLAAYQNVDDNGTYIDADSKYMNTESKTNGGRIDAIYLNVS